MKKANLLLLLLVGAAACATGGYLQADVAYGRPRPARYVYVVPVDRVVIVTRDVLVSRGWVVYRVQRSGRERIIWARHGDDRIVRIFATPDGNRVMLRGWSEVREREYGRHGKHGKYKGWKRHGPPDEIMTQIDVRLRAR